ncbi:hypothetical protein M3Y94_00227200 [Aphelenchoides besseyi]|nr:hypothetical protein M3Y94_00227200 [Aphelenchoides besseyi]KAI6236472.1 hypothetical protein M3Y95_00161300 [Aphelenchoides besseyi]
MFGNAMKRQNSVPNSGTIVHLSAESPVDKKSRRMSHDVNSVKIQRSQQRSTNSVGLRRFQQSPPSTRTITFGFASAVQQQPPPSRTKRGSDDSHTSSCYDEEDLPSTSTPDDCPQVVVHGQPEAADFFIRLADGQVVPLFCQCPSGSEANAFLKSLPEKQKDRLKRFVENEKPETGEFHLWIREDENAEITVISLKAFENHLRHENVKRVKWRHSSTGKVSIYRYSVPVITTKFRLRLLHCLTRNYRCCILCLWCVIILFISLGIVGTVIFGQSNANSRFANGTAIPRTGHLSANGSPNRTAAMINYVHQGGMALQGG